MGKEIREILKGGNVEFTIEDITTYCMDDNGNYGYNPRVFKVDINSTFISSFNSLMNVNKWGPTCVTLYSYDMLGKRTTGLIKYSDITLQEIKVECSASLDNEWYYE